HDVDEGQSRIACGARVKLGGRTCANTEQQDERTPRRRRDADEREDDDAGPDQTDAPRCAIHLSASLVLRGSQMTGSTGTADQLRPNSLEVELHVVRQRDDGDQLPAVLSETVQLFLAKGRLV